MKRTHQLLNSAWIVAVLAASLPLGAYQAPQAKAFRGAVETRVSVASLWQDRGNIESLDVLNGLGGKAHAPTGKFTFVKEDLEGTNPKFEVVDEQGVKWKAKLGSETRPETAATRLLWAAGYFTDEDYYVAELRVDKMARLERGRQFVSADGVVRGVRLERHVKGQKKNGTWSWRKNPLEGTRELSGLKVMMALINNWDLKDSNNVIYSGPGDETRYAISDLGATFGRTGNTMSRSKGDLKDYQESKFMKKAGPEHVSFSFHSRPLFFMIFHVPYYVERTKMQGIVKHIPREHAKWMGQQLARLSPEQLRDCFRAAGFSPAEVEGYAVAVQGRIAELNRL